MAIQFSSVTLSADGKMKDFLVCGEPSDCEDLEGWTAYEDFTAQLPEGTQVHADVDTYLYGGEDIVEATPEEVAYMTIRSSRDYSIETIFNAVGITCRAIQPDPLFEFNMRRNRILET